MGKKHAGGDGHLITTRAAFVLLVSLAAAVSIGMLTFEAHSNLAEAVVAGFVAFAAAVPLLTSLVGP